jgi:hypothetical protein
MSDFWIVMLVPAFTNFPHSKAAVPPVVLLVTPMEPSPHFLAEPLPTVRTEMAVIIPTLKEVT